MARYVIYGAGAVGGTIGGRLFQHGHDVVLIARGEHGRVIERDGLRLVSADDDVTLTVPCVQRPDELLFTDHDIVILAMKSQDTSAALHALTPLAGPTTPVVCAQNGVENERVALRLFDRVYGMCVFLPATHVEPGIVAVASSPVSGVLDLGRFPEGSDAVAEQMASDLEGSQLRSEVLPQIMRRKYNKLLRNLANAVDAAAGGLAARSELVHRATAEALACFAAAGIDVATDDEDAERRAHLTMRPVAGWDTRHSSSWQSLARGTRRIEADYLNGEIVLLGRLHGVPTPVNARLQAVANRLAYEGAAPGSIRLDDLETVLG